MSEFNKVFLVVKKHCDRQKRIAEIHSFDIIAKEAGVPTDKLDIYLDYLQRMDLIKYSITEKYLYLTAFGQKQEQIAK